MPYAVGWIISGLLWLVRNRIGFIITSILVWLGVSLATNTVVVQPLIDQIMATVQGMDGSGTFGSHALATLRYLNFDRALTMVFSAYLAKTAVSGAKVFLAKRAA